ncbi:hypothetical protein Back2_03260 [Nocardioides baekrokdamisoli]|uniref:DUF4878 domain-containing protein n=1 Tax=Nocardioides baekrokdamisoli TaxID=1804624 RepID=A0A3G9IZA7_9ACTN|nr:hypothetical protein [Nocardioides baekrokdamisoli]BBH16039.1 hypothetical protein Back2_03260 [Nocardioides baekrokdamisoli]
MSLPRPLAYALAPLLLAGLVACGSSKAAPSVKDAALAFQTALLNDDPAGACSHIDPAFVTAQIAKAGPLLKGKDCTTLFTTVLTLAKSTGQPIRPAKDITVLSQTSDTASVRITDATGNVQISTWKLENGGWKVTATGAN